jgi:hypothetical protein
MRKGWNEFWYTFGGKGKEAERRDWGVREVKR